MQENTHHLTYLCIPIPNSIDHGGQICFFAVGHRTSRRRGATSPGGGGLRRRDGVHGRRLRRLDHRPQLPRLVAEVQLHRRRHSSVQLRAAAARRVPGDAGRVPDVRPDEPDRAEVGVGARRRRARRAGELLLHLQRQRPLPRRDEILRRRRRAAASPVAAAASPASALPGAAPAAALRLRRCRVVDDAATVDGVDGAGFLPGSDHRHVELAGDLLHDV